MSALRRLGTLLANWIVVLTQRLLGLLRGSSVHVIITGPDLEGMNHLAVLLRALGPEYRPALETASSLRRLIITVDLDDITRSASITPRLSPSRSVVVLAATADPRQMVCRIDQRLPHQWPDGFDYRFRFGSGGVKSFTEPGVLPRFDGLDRWKSTAGVTVITVSREDLASAPAEALSSLAAALRSRPTRHLSARLDSLADTAHALTPPSDSPGRTFEDRIAQQVLLAPTLEERAVSLGYDPTPPGMPSAQSTVGTIIAFHTPDEVYRAEAARLRASLDALGLRHQFFEVTPEHNWVRTTLLKPSWLLKAREEIAGPLLYLDVDAFVHRDPWPYLSQYDGDLAAVVYDNGELNSASIWINDTPGARELLGRWKTLADARRDQDQGQLEPTGDNGDQGVLRQAVLAAEAEGDETIRFQRFPVNLTYIFDRGDLYYTVGPVIVEQLQASRESTGHEKRLARRRERLRELEGSLTGESNGVESASVSEG